MHSLTKDFTGGGDIKRITRATQSVNTKEHYYANGKR